MTVRSDDPAHSPDAQVLRFGTDLARQIDLLWCVGSRPDVREFIGQHDGLTPPQILEVLKVDQRHRWRVGDPVLVNSYLENFPGLRTDLEVTLDLIWSEYLIRESLGSTPDLLEYVRSFPNLETLLRRQHEVHEWVEQVDEMGPSSIAGLEILNHIQLARDAAELEKAHGRSLSGTDACPFQLPGFDVLNMVGRGGMGIVYRARQLSLDREVALKVLPPALAADSVRLRRFHNEAVIASRLTDSRILPVFDILEVGGAPVLVMPFVDGWDLEQILAARGAVQRGESPEGKHPSSALAGREFVRFMLPILDQVVTAVAAIHEAGVIHRDIKPSNILIDRRQEVRLTDFGLARLGREAVITAEGQKMGTAGFMSPEQWTGESDIDARADVFGLGATLYQALTLEMPYGRDRVTRHSPSPARHKRNQPSLPGELDAVILKALEPDRNNRYTTAEELREDWQRARTGLLPMARRPVLYRRLARWVHRHPWVATNVGVTSLLLSMAGAMLMQSRAIPSSLNRLRATDLITAPSNARFALVPLDASNGGLHPELAVRRGNRATTPVRLRIPPGDYLVVVQWPDGRFHEVYRHVPREGETPAWYRHRRWVTHSGVVELPAVEIPTPGVLDEMVHFEGSAEFKMAFEHGQAIRPSERGLSSYYLDRHEVSVKDYLRLAHGLPAGMRDKPVGPDEVVRFVSFDEATYFAELMGKRLPDEAEYEFAATGGGLRLFPGDDPVPYLRVRTWPFGPIEEPAFDRTATNMPVYGLYSNAAEWTSSWFIPTSGSFSKKNTSRSLPSLDSSQPPWPGSPSRMRVIRGGPPSVVMGRPDPSEFALGPGFRVGQALDHSWLPGVGFRGARSTKPRFLDGDTRKPSR